MQRLRQSHAVGRGLARFLKAIVRQVSDRRGRYEVALIRSQEVLDLRARPADGDKGGVDRIDQNRDLRRVSAIRFRREGLKAVDAGRLAVLEQMEVALLQPADGVSRLVGDDDIERNR